MVERPGFSGQKRTRKHPRREPAATRDALLRAACELLAREGHEGLQFSKVARRARLTRATAYRHFETIEQLHAACAEWGADKLHVAVFDHPGFGSGQPIGAVDAREMVQRLTDFAMNNPEICSLWLQEQLGSDAPRNDRFWQSYVALMERFAGSRLAQNDIDVEVHSVLMLAGTFLWPIWVHSKARSMRDRDRMSQRFREEMIRLALNGVFRRVGPDPGDAAAGTAGTQ